MLKQRKQYTQYWFQWMDRWARLAHTLGTPFLAYVVILKFQGIHGY